MSNFLKFLSQRSYANESVNVKTTHIDKCRYSHTHVATGNTTGNQGKCYLCDENHGIFKCPRFLAQNIDERVVTVKAQKLCFNCLKKGHAAAVCNSRRCKHCNAKHNSLIHYNAERPSTDVEVTCHSSNIKQFKTSQILLGTAVILVQDSSNNWCKAKVLLDSGSQSNFISHSFLRKLKYHTEPTQLSVLGVNETQTISNLKATICIKSRFSNTVRKLSFNSLPSITAKLPSKGLNTRLWNLPTVKLADPEFGTPKEIDMLIGAEIYLDILRLDQIKLGEGLPIMQNTEFGWIITGRVDMEDNGSPTCCSISTSELDAQLIKFWKIEELTDRASFTTEERFVENHFKSTHTRNSDGRFVVAVPKKLNPELLGESKTMAMKRFLELEKRLSNDQNLKTQYTQFMREYQELEHMEEISAEPQKKSCYFLPHHPVVKETSITTKVRVVFDASSETSTGLSLNDILMVGPTIQDDLTELLVRFREHKYVVTSDITKMYRQIRVSDEDTNLQLILWREEPQDNIKTFKLKTVTYGTAPAPFLAIRSLQDLANTTSNETVNKVLLQDFYVDDLITGADSCNDLQDTIDDLTRLLGEAGFKLNKWASNHASLLEKIAEKNETSVIIFDKTSTIKTLGLLRNSFQDIFYF